MWNHVYAVIGSVVLLGYGALSLTGREIGTFGRESAAQAGSRHMTGGHRSHAFWFFRGGK